MVQGVTSNLTVARETWRQAAMLLISALSMCIQWYVYLMLSRESDSSVHSFTYVVKQRDYIRIPYSNFESECQ